MADATLFTAATTGAVSNLENAFFALHDGTGSGDQVSNERLQPNYGSASNGEADLAEPLEFTGTPSDAVSHLGVWTAAEGGSLRFTVELSGDLAFNAAGELKLTSAKVTVGDN